MFEHLLSVALVLVVAGEAVMLLVAISLVLVAASAVLQETSE